MSPGSGGGAVGVLGGSFDPIHVGHLRIADRVREALGVDELLLLVSATPPHKAARAVTPARHRLEMVRLALAGHPGLALCTLETDAGGVNYTIDTLRRIRLGRPAREPVFVLGGDSLFDLGGWRQARRLVEEFDFVVVERPGHDLAANRERLEPWIRSRMVPLIPLPPAGGTRGRRPGAGGRVFRFAMERMPVSSSSIRAKVGRGEAWDALVPPAVAGYISTHGLYRREESH
jgi:nicotinate-nucleotide adenylyltransferase